MTVARARRLGRLAVSRRASDGRGYGTRTTDGGRGDCGAGDCQQTEDRLPAGGTVSIHQPSGAQRPWRRTVARAVTWAGAGGEEPDSASWLACLQRELEAREATVKSEGGPWGRGTVVRAGEAAYTTGDWWLGSRKRGGPRKARTSKSGGRVVRAWKSVAGELVVPGKAWAWRSNSTVSLEKRRCGGRGADNNWGHDEGWRLPTRDWRQGEREGSRRQREEEQQETAAAQWRRGLIFSSQPMGVFFSLAAQENLPAPPIETTEADSQ